MFNVWEVREPWVTNEILEEINDKDRLLKTARRTGKKEDWEHAKRDRKRVGRQVEQARDDFLMPGKKWKSRKFSLTYRNNEGESSIVKPADTANFLNEFFSNIGPKLACVLNEP